MHYCSQAIAHAYLMSALANLCGMNGVALGRVLHSNVTCTDIIDHIANEMRKKLVNNIVNIKPPISVRIDESTSLSQKTCMIVYIRCSFDSTTQPLTLFLDLIELIE